MDLPIHRLLEEDRPQDAVPAEYGAGNDSSAHGVYQIEHLLVIAVRALVRPYSRSALGVLPPL